MARPLTESGIPIDKVRELDVVREIMRLKEREGTQPIDQARGLMVEEIRALKAQYEVNK
jgi:hypothetical protein